MQKEGSPTGKENKQNKTKGKERMGEDVQGKRRVLLAISNVQKEVSNSFFPTKIDSFPQSALLTYFLVPSCVSL